MPVRLEAIRPKKRPVYDPRAMRTAVDAALDETAQAMIRDFEKTTATWETDVEFRVFGRQGGGVGRRGVSITVGTDNEIYGYVSRGTVPHIISARSGGFLIYQGNYRSKTVPGRLMSRQGGMSGRTRFRRQVYHPGNEARNFDLLVARRHGERGTLQKNVQKHWNRVFRQAR